MVTAEAPPTAGAAPPVPVRASPDGVEQALEDARALQPTDPLAARELAFAAEHVATAIGDHAGRANAAYRLASIAFVTGAFDEALAHVVEARALARDHGVPTVEAWSLNLLGLAHMRAGNYSEALELCMAALDVYRRTSHRADEGNLLNVIASIHVQLGDIERALSTYEEARAATRGAGRPQHDAILVANIAHLHLKRGAPTVAVEVGTEALALAREHARTELPDVLTTLGEAHDAAGDHERALALFDEALSACDELERDGDTPPRAQLHALLARGRSRAAGGDTRGAEADLRAVLRAADADNALQLQLDAHTALAELLKERGDYEEALTHAEARFALNQTIFNEGTDLRIRTLQIAHDTEHARQEAEIYRLRTTELEAMVQERTRDLEESQLDTLTRLAVLGEFRDTDTGEHTVRVGDMSGRLAEALGLDHAYVDHMRVAGRLHDIGKVGIADAILLKPGPLTADEFTTMKSHTTIGAQVLSGSTSPFIQLAEEVASNHHERWDGTGYPNGRSGEQIPLSGRIVTVADVFDALTTERPYKRSWTFDEAVRYITQASGTQFDPAVVMAFLRLLEERPVNVR